MRINVSITKEDLQLIDDYCTSTGIKRSTFFTRSALKEVGVHKKDIDAIYSKANDRTNFPTSKPKKKEPVHFNPVPKPKKKK